MIRSIMLGLSLKNGAELAHVMEKVLDLMFPSMLSEVKSRLLRAYVNVVSQPTLSRRRFTLDVACMLCMRERNVTIGLHAPKIILADSSPIAGLDWFQQLLHRDTR